jgi:FkbM family methyltransferase
MFELGGYFLPDGETKMIPYANMLDELGQEARNRAYSYVKAWRRALDVGANVGIYSRDFATRFKDVAAFEPVPSTRECLALNVPSNVRIEPVGLADAPGVLKMYNMKSCGASFICNHPQVVTPEGLRLKTVRTIEVEVRTIDSFDYDAVDLIKLDIQGAEYLALLGARETILRHQPVILVEEKAFNEAHAKFIQKASALLISYGMTPKEQVGADRIYVFETC